MECARGSEWMACILPVFHSITSSYFPPFTPTDDQSLYVPYITTVSESSHSHIPHLLCILTALYQLYYVILVSWPPYSYRIVSKSIHYVTSGVRTRMTLRWDYIMYISVLYSVIYHVLSCISKIIYIYTTLLTIYVWFSVFVFFINYMFRR